jgi:hypothetical protein
VGLDAGTWAAATKVNLHEKTTDNRDTSNFLPLLKNGSELYLQQKTDATRWGRYTVTVPGTDMGDWWQFTVTLIASSGAVPGGNADTTVTAKV